MPIIKPTIPSGTRDFRPDQTKKRNFIFDTLKKIFELHNFLPIETPAMENLTTLLGKYGDEGDKLIYRIINSGDFLKDIPDELWHTKDTKKWMEYLCDKGLRYDLTVPLARYVVMHRNEINFPFKRYQIQPVWRADRPQKGRYREFYQCDVDIIATDSLLAEIELISLVDEAFTELQVKTITKINNRKILQGIANWLNLNDTEFINFTTILDKLDKIGLDGVLELFKNNAWDDEKISKLKNLINFSSSNNDWVEIINYLDSIFINNDIGKAGLNELKFIFDNLSFLELQNRQILDITLARGLNYYTGTIFEVVCDEVSLGSICGGGRYDNLTALFGLDNVSGVGISFGAERIYDIMEKLNKFPENIINDNKILIINFGENYLSYCLSILSNLRKANLKADLYPDDAKLKKQFNYADALNYKYVIIVGEDEIANDEVSIKNMISGEQVKISKNNIILYLKN
ncbi:MAG: histidine--tRNA ligase [Bacteroidales bacterium]|jgi:histidyl-tRNA synthetase|nr:histidine--tRNA ligase [Bacteroidales bacterium]